MALKMSPGAVMAKPIGGDLWEVTLLDMRLVEGEESVHKVKALTSDEACSRVMDGFLSSINFDPETGPWAALPPAVSYAKFGRIEEEDVPPFPARVHDGVIDEGNHRWRFKGGRIAAYFRYAPPLSGWDVAWFASWYED